MTKPNKDIKKRKAINDDNEDNNNFLPPSPLSSSSSSSSSSSITKQKRKKLLQKKTVAATISLTKNKKSFQTSSSSTTSSSSSNNSSNIDISTLMTRSSLVLDLVTYFMFHRYKELSMERVTLLHHHHETTTTVTDINQLYDLNKDDCSTTLTSTNISDVITNSSPLKDVSDIPNALCTVKTHLKEQKEKIKQHKCLLKQHEETVKRLICTGQDLHRRTRPCP